MTQRNIHGTWEMSFEHRCLKSKIKGATNKEAALAWLEDLKYNLRSSPEGSSVPWVVLQDLSDWGAATLDTWGDANANIDWVFENNCVLFAIIFSTGLQEFVMKKGLKDNNYVRFFFDYDEAYQACLAKLAESQIPQGK